jgi:cohesin complex subunit SA-1/2
VPKVKKPRKGAKGGAAAASSAEESEGEKALDEDEAAPRPRPKPRRATRANPHVIEDETAIGAGDEPDPVTPKARLRPRPTYRDKTPIGSLHGSENGQKSRSGSPLPPVTPSEGAEEQGEPNNDIATPKSSLKRPRTDDDDEPSGAHNGTSDPDHLMNVDGTPDMQIRRKRIRH